MDFGSSIVKFVILMAVVCVPLILLLRWALLNSTEGAVKRLNAEVEQNRSKQAELNQKIKEADEELAKRKAEANDLANKMIAEAEEKALAEREKMIARARAEGEEIITKAQGTKDQIRRDLEKEMYLKAIDYALQILTLILSQDIQKVLNGHLFVEFLEGLKKVDMSRIGPEVGSAEIVTAIPLEDRDKEQLTQLLLGKLNRTIKFDFLQDQQIVGGVMLKFGNLVLDGSLQKRIKEEAVQCKQKTENQ
ncbi:MAG TPA: F0F1 ATP synthase subunit delta [Candidatus Omnitrophota bacterium]|nr:F0F1 ATP synthase subunit delta [Candidatus Omnitrophota bacterium]